MTRKILFLALMCLLPIANAADRIIGVEWDPVEDARVARYEVHWGRATGNYNQEVSVPVETTQAEVTLTELGSAYIVARACSDTLCSDWSNELEVYLPDKPIQLRLRLSLTIDTQVSQ